MSKRAAIYCRISQDREGAGLGVDRQRADCLALARKLGWSVVAEHVDNDMSAYSGKPRPGYRALLDDIQSRCIDAVIVWHTDRLHRSPRELEEYVDVCERSKIVTQTVKAGELDLATPSGRAVARTLGAWARFEVEHKSERTRRAQRQAAEAGRWLGGAPPLGWNLRGDGSATLDRPAARRIKSATRDVIAGTSLGSIVKRWNDDGFTTGTGRSWNYATLRQVLTRARNAGLIELNGAIVGQSMWPRIVTEDEWRALCAVLADPTRRRSQTNRAKHLLAGIAVCGAPGCGLPMRSATATSANGRRIVYRCRAGGGGHAARSAEHVDAFVDGIVRGILGRKDASQLLANDDDRPDIEEARDQAVILRARLADYQQRAADIDAVDFAAATRTLRDRLTHLEAKLAEVARGSALAGVVDARDPVRAWAMASIERRRAIVRELMDVTIVPLPPGANMKEFDPRLIRVVPKVGIQG